MSWDSLEEAFKDLDSNEFAFFSKALSAYRRALMKDGFTRREAMRLVEAYSRFIYDMSVEEFMVQNDKKRFSSDDVDDDDDPDI